MHRTTPQCRVKADGPLLHSTCPSLCIQSRTRSSWLHHLSTTITDAGTLATANHTLVKKCSGEAWDPVPSPCCCLMAEPRKHSWWDITSPLPMCLVHLCRPSCSALKNSVSLEHLPKSPVYLDMPPKHLMHRKQRVMANLQPTIWSQFLLGVRPVKLI